MMNIKQAAILTTAVGLVLGMSAPAHAELGFYVSSNAVDKCQAFTPGISNTIRNRVVGAENSGTATIAVACVFELQEVYGAATVITDDITVSFRNNGTTPTTVTCTLLPGTLGASLGVAVTQTTGSMPVGGGASTTFTGPWSVYGIGVNCSLPPAVILNHTVIRYRNDEIP